MIQNGYKGNIMEEFEVGDDVIIKHQPELGECIVVDPHDETDMTLVGSGKPVGYYVRIDTPKNKDQGYHPWNLEKV